MSEDASLRDQEVTKKGKGDVELYSVTTIVGEVQRAYALEAWGRREVATAALRQLDYWRTVEEHQGTDEAIYQLAGAPFKKQKDPRTGEFKRTAAELGSFVHALCEEYALSDKRPELDPDDEANPFLDRFYEWAQVTQPRWVAAEMNIYHEALVYGGCLDAVMELDTSDGVLRALTDYKTSRKAVTGGRNSRPTEPYPDQVGLQLAGYGGHGDDRPLALPVPARRWTNNRSRYYLLGQPEREQLVPLPDWDVGMVLHITPRHCHAHPINLGPRVWRKWLVAIEMFQWIKEEAPRIMGAPLAVPGLPTTQE